MIEYVKGELIEVTPAYAVVETHGVGYSRAMQLVMRHSHDAIPVSRSNVNKLKELLG